ncbi:fatty acid desaturase CarF family protein [Leptospira sp. GIMC2001]|uniref:fatty acid desaturase CarF family protein n=1 Tax=Leptospira sp. GIMC2001 TaxID=1513297 RepID=UPI00234B124F|nr:fatty acid desaturase CarF family protein [Leptospira sp. GIMC2001]WCL48519.1 kua-ubiquitin conjugating enzyme hybrid localization domain protein [Leptospira sp. GIMC2001]
MSEQSYSYSKTHRSIEIFSIISFILIILGLGYHLVQGYNSFHSKSELFGLILTLVIIFSYISADFISGLVHFLGDSFGTEETPIVGASFIKPFRDHHTDPEGITRHDFIETNGNNCIVSLPVLIAVYFYLPYKTDVLSYLLAWFILALMLGIFMTNQIHKWAHLKNPGVVIKFLQDRSFILNPDHHKIHHTAPFDRYFCITCGWLNPFLYRIRFFEFILLLFKKNKKAY